MVTRRTLIALAAALPALIPRIDWDATAAADPHFTANTEAGLETSDLGLSHLLQMERMGPYMQFAWLDQEAGQELPTVRGLFWVSAYQETRLPLNLGLNFGEGWFNRTIDPQGDLDQVGMVEKEAVIRTIRLIIREHAGVETRFIQL